MIKWLLLLLFLVVITRADDDATFSVRHFLNDYDRSHILAYAGYPPRSTNFALLFSVPQSAGVHLNTSADAQDVDLPGQFAALHIKNSDALSVPYRTQWAVDTSSVMTLPKMKLITLGSTFWFAVNGTSGADYADYGPQTRGILYVGPGSAVYSRWRYADISQSRFTLTDVAPARKRTQLLTCKRFDEANRCVIKVSDVVLAYYDGRQVTQPPLELILDFASGSGQLPQSWYAELLASRNATNILKNHVAEVRWRGLTLASTSDVSTGTSTSGFGATDDTGTAVTSVPMFITTSTTAIGANTIILGRRAMARLFQTSTYDSSTASFSVVFNSELSETIRGTLMIMAILQVIILVRYIVSPYNLSMRKLVLTPIADRKHFFGASLKVTLLEGLGIVLALIQTSVGFLFVGDGYGVDYDLAEWLWTFSVITLSLVVVQSVAWALFTWLLWGTGGESITRGLVAAGTVQHSIYASTAAMGLVVGFLPAGAISMVPLLTAALIGGFVVTNLFYNAQMVIMLAAGDIVDVKDSYFRWCIPHVLFQLASFGIFSWAWSQYILWPVVSAWNVRFGSNEEPMVAYIFLTLAVVAVLWLIFGEVRHLFDQYMEDFEKDA